MLRCTILFCAISDVVYELTMIYFIISNISLIYFLEFKKAHANLMLNNDLLLS